MENWLDKEIEFYDFIWKVGVSMCTKCINKELLEDFQSGGDSFEQMKKIILKKFKTRELAEKAFNNK